jgi:hypothetical protein
MYKQLMTNIFEPEAPKGQCLSLEIWEDVVTNFYRMTRRKRAGFTKTNSCMADHRL